MASWRSMDRHIASGARKTLKRSWNCCKHLEVMKKSLPLQHDWIKATCLVRKWNRCSAPNWIPFSLNKTLKAEGRTHNPKLVLQILTQRQWCPKLFNHENTAFDYAEASYRSRRYREACQGQGAHAHCQWQDRESLFALPSHFGSVRWFWMNIDRFLAVSSSPRCL